MGVFDTAWLVAVVLAATPLVLAAMGELVSERAGVLNVGLEGMMVLGAFFGFFGATHSGSWVVGALVGTAAGLVVGAIAAGFSVWARADQIVVGIGINVLGLALSAYVFSESFGAGDRAGFDRPPRVAIPLLSDLPVVGRVLFEQQVFVYLAALSVAAVWFVLYRTGWGLSLRAVGENPSAADSAGLVVWRVRFAGNLVAGALAALGGAFLSIAQVGTFTQGMSAGRGFLALAAVIFGRWRPLGVLGACIVFGAADALQFRLQARGDVPVEVWVAGAVALAALLVVLARRPLGATTRSRRSLVLAIVGVGAVAMAAGAVLRPDVTMPPQVWLALPYVLTLFVLGGAVGRSRAPSALGVPFRRTVSTV